MCKQCAGPIDRQGKRTQYCSACVVERRRQSWRNWRSQPGSGEKIAQYQRQKRAEDADYSYKFLIKSRYGITVEDYYRLLAAQNGGCAICGSPEPKTGNQKHLQIDHDHKCCPGNRSCGKCVRGLLCGVCNKMLGAIGDDMLKLERAINYLKDAKS